MLGINCLVPRGWSCALTKSVEFGLRTVEKMGSILSFIMSALFAGGLWCWGLNTEGMLGYVEPSQNKPLENKPLEKPLDEVNASR